MVCGSPSPVTKRGQRGRGAQHPPHRGTDRGHGPAEGDGQARGTPRNFPRGGSGGCARRAGRQNPSFFIYVCELIYVCVPADPYSGRAAPSPLARRCRPAVPPARAGQGPGVPGCAQRSPCARAAPRRTHPEHEGVDDEEGFQTRYHGFGLHSPRCHNTEIPAAGWAREEAEEEGGKGEGEGSGGAEGGELSARPGSPRLLPPLLLLLPGDPRPGHGTGPNSTRRVTFTGISRGGEVLTDELKHIPVLGKALLGLPGGLGMEALHGRSCRGHCPYGRKYPSVSRLKCVFLRKLPRSVALVGAGSAVLWLQPGCARARALLRTISGAGLAPRLCRAPSSSRAGLEAESCDLNGASHEQVMKLLLQPDPGLGFGSASSLNSVLKLLWTLNPSQTDQSSYFYL